MSDEFDVIGPGKFPVRCFCKRVAGEILLFVISETGEFQKLPQPSFRAAMDVALQLTKQAREAA